MCMVERYSQREAPWFLCDGWVKYRMFMAAQDQRREERIGTKEKRKRKGTTGKEQRQKWITMIKGPFAHSLTHETEV